MKEASTCKGSSRLEGMIGLGIILIAGVLLFLKIEPIPTFFTPIAWTGYILAADSLVFKIKGKSLLRNRMGEFLFMFPLSLLVWLCFEGYNLHLKNWYYTNLPANPWMRWSCFCWSFATILPAIMETTELYSSLRLFEITTKRFHLKKRVSHPLRSPWFHSPSLSFDSRLSIRQIPGDSSLGGISPNSGAHKP